MSVHPYRSGPLERPRSAKASGRVPGWQLLPHRRQRTQMARRRQKLVFRSPNGSPLAVDESANGAASQPGVPEQLFALQPNVGDWDVTAGGSTPAYGVFMSVSVAIWINALRLRHRPSKSPDHGESVTLTIQSRQILTFRIGDNMGPGSAAGD
jgi:hypothetical protein